MTDSQNLMTLHEEYDNSASCMAEPDTERVFREVVNNTHAKVKGY